MYELDQRQQVRARFQDAYTSLGCVTNRPVERDIVLREAGSTELNPLPCHGKATRPQKSGCLRQRAEGGRADERGGRNDGWMSAPSEQHMTVLESG
jgi:hypothetical protein